jgi:FMN reductase
MTRRTVVVVSAGLSQPSSTRLLADRLADATVEELDRLGTEADVRVVELREYAHDLMNHMLAGFPSPRLKEVIDTVTGADAVVAVTPIFNASYSGLFKSFFDVLEDDALIDKPVLIAATGGTERHSLALEHALRPMFTYLRAVVVPTSVFAATGDWADDGAGGGGAPDVFGLAGGLPKRIQRAAGELAAQIRLREPARPADPFALTTSFERLLAGE